MVKFLIVEENANVNRVHEDSNTPLWMASKVRFYFSLMHCSNIYCFQNGHLDVVRFLIEKGAKVDQKDNLDGETPLFIASEVCLFVAAVT